MPETMSMQTSNGRCQVDYTGYVGEQSTLYFLQTGQDLVCWDLSVHPFLCSHLLRGNFWEPRYINIGKPRGNGHPYSDAVEI
jgi:hypothetical protein